MADEKECFIIMPITTPDIFLEKYRDEKEHFKHVLDCLFVPSIEKAGYKPIPPKAKGSDIIQENIIKNLDTTDLVLCDMSCLNPNVFFEFGIRTSLNKPVCVVKDELTEKVPFDTSILNYQEYKSAIEPWDLENEIRRLSEHIKTSAEKSEGENTMWKVFGIKSKAIPYEAKGGSDEKLEYLSLQIKSMRDKMDMLSERSPESSLYATEDSIEVILKNINRKVPKNVFLVGAGRTSEGIFVRYNGFWSRAQRINIKREIFSKYGEKIHFIPLKDDDLKGEEYITGAT